MLAVVPTLLATGLLIWQLLTAQRSAIEESIFQQTRALRHDLDRETAFWKDLAEVLARSSAITRNDWRELHDLASRASGARPGTHVVLVRQDGARLFDTREPYGTPLAPAFDAARVFADVAGPSAATGDPQAGMERSRALNDERWRQLFREERGHFSGLFIDAAGAASLAYRQPVTAGDGQRFSISVLFPPSALNGVMRNSTLADTGIVTVLDSAGTYIARNARTEQTDYPIGRTASAFADVPQDPRTEYVREANSLEGERLLLARSYSSQTGWVLGLGVPLKTANDVLQSSLLLWSIGVAGLFAIAVFGSRRIWREIGIPLRTLAQNASAFERGEPLRFPVSRIREVREAGRAWELAIEADLGRRAQERLRLAAEARRAEIEQANREKDEVLAALGHELRNPLAAISNGVEVIGANAPPEPSLTAMIAVLKRQTGHLGRLLDDMFDLARATFGKLEIRRAPIELHKLAEQTLAAYDGRRGKIASIRLVGSPAWVEGDSTRLDQVIRNLVDNAIKSTAPQGNIVVSVQPDGDQAILRVTDDGIGMPQELLDRVFIPFVQDDQKLDRTRGGLGLGLALVRQIIELHGGAVGIASDGVGCGATVTATLDRIDPPVIAETKAAPIDAPAMKVLLVEDQPDLRESLKLLLEIMDLVDVRDAGTGGEALQILGGWQPNVALLDIGLPDIDGFELARRIRADAGLAEVRLVAMTGFSENTHREEAVEAGFDAYLVKPVSRNKLAATLAEVTSRSEQSSGG